jgi:hypothetical protein
MQDQKTSSGGQEARRGLESSAVKQSAGRHTGGRSSEAAPATAQEGGLPMQGTTLPDSAAAHAKTDGEPVTLDLSDADATLERVSDYIAATAAECAPGLVREYLLAVARNVERRSSELASA